jgi:hypothetical protein
MHLPPTQLCVGLQTVSQAPQLFTSESNRAQAPPQLVCSGGQSVVQFPFTQVCPVRQALKQAPQLLGLFASTRQL